jgi:hypothetical protein
MRKTLIYQAKVGDKQSRYIRRYQLKVDLNQKSFCCFIVYNKATKASLV